LRNIVKLSEQRIAYFTVLRWNTLGCSTAVPILI
jgi:hypothetical protein